MQDQDLIREFVVESHENLSQLDEQFVELEKKPKDAELLAAIFRTFHTVKGTCGFLGFSTLEKLTHQAENILSQLRNGERELTPELVSLILETVDATRKALGVIEATGAEGADRFENLIERLRATAQNAADDADASEKAQTQAVEATPAPAPQQAPAPVPAAEPVPSHPPEAVRHEEETAKAPSLGDTNVRVAVGLLDKLMDLVGELVLTRNQILQFNGQREDAALNATAQRLNLLTTELQEGVMKTRMQRIGTVWNKLPRVVRDVALALGKQIHLEMDGAETELDRTIIEAIKDPLVHLVRNACDHGIEAPELRTQAGKPAQGRLGLRAYHEGGQVNIEISDDGAGMDAARLKQKALDKGLLRPEQAERLSERDALNLIFQPGFSTADKVTNLSGRGVGMDVVKTNIEKIGGTVDIQSAQGLGTTIKIKIPLTLAIIPALIVTSAGDRYAIPQISLLELVRLEGDEATRGIETIHGVPVYRLRGRLLPLVYLNQALGVDRERAAFATAAAQPQTGNAFARRKEILSLDFNAAKEAHEAWKTRLRHFLNGEGDLDAKVVAKNDRCVLGRWLYSPAMKQFRYPPELRQLENAHTALHEQAAKIVSLKQANDSEGAEGELATLRGMSEQLVSLLCALERSTAETASVSIVVLQADGNQFGLIVDAVNDTEEIVVKPLGRQLKGLSMYAGATIMGDGRIALILDVLGIGQRAGVLGEAREQARVVAERKLSSGVEQRLLLFEAGTFERLAVPLSLVARLEEFPRSSVERAGGRLVVQYRNRILPLIPLQSVLEPGQANATEIPDPLDAIVFQDGDHSVGLVVNRILDIVEEAVAVREKGSHRGLLGTAVVGKRVTDFLDLHYVLQKAVAEWFEDATGKTAGKSVLVAEPSTFSRSLIRAELEMAGYQVFEASSVEEAVLRLDDQPADVVLAAIDLPTGGSAALAAALRQSPERQAIPVVVLADSADQARAVRVEFSDCQVKFDHEAMLGSVAQLIAAGVRAPAVPECVRQER